MYDLSEDIELDKNIKHDIDIVVDRLVMKEGIRSRVADSVELALKLADGLVKIAFTDDTPELEYSQNYACKVHGTTLGELSPRMFSFNNPYGACETCGGLGESFIFSPKKIIPDDSLSLYNGAVIVNGFKSLEAGSWTGNMINSVGKAYGFDIHTPIKDLSPAALHTLLYGNVTKGRRAPYGEVKFAGIIPMIQKRFELTKDEEQRNYYEEFMEYIPCPSCHGDRLKKSGCAYVTRGKSFDNRSSVNAAAFITASLNYVNKNEVAYLLYESDELAVRSLPGIIGGINRNQYAEYYLISDSNIPFFD
jgi:excinuclease ABC subunit A